MNGVRPEAVVSEVLVDVLAGSLHLAENEDLGPLFFDHRQKLLELPGLLVLLDEAEVLLHVGVDGELIGPDSDTDGLLPSREIRLLTCRGRKRAL